MHIKFFEILFLKFIANNKVLSIISKDKIIEIPKEFLNAKYEKEQLKRIKNMAM